MFDIRKIIWNWVKKIWKCKLSSEPISLRTKTVDVSDVLTTFLSNEYETKVASLIILPEILAIARIRREECVVRLHVNKFILL